MVSRCWCHQMGDVHWQLSLLIRWPPKHRRKHPVPTLVLTRAVALICVIHLGKHISFLVPIQLETSSMGLPGRIISFELYYPFSSYLASLTQSPHKLTTQPQLLFLHQSYFVISVHKFEGVLMGFSVISALYDISDVHSCPCKVWPSKDCQQSHLNSHEVQPAVM